MQATNPIIQQLVDQFVALNERGSDSAAPPEPPEPPLPHGPGDGTPDDMERRVTRLETHMDYVQRDLRGISDKLDTIIDRTGNLPTKADLSTFRWQWVATAVAAIALIVGGIIGGLGWLKPDDPTPAPVVVHVPTGAPAIGPTQGVNGAPKP